MTRKYSWIPDLPDYRDKMFMSRHALLSEPLPEKVDLRDRYDNVYDQGQLGSCTANAIAMAVDFELVKQGLQPLLPSRLFIYYNERALEGTINSDAGAMIRDGIKTVIQTGVCPETDWPYDESKFADKPGDTCYADAQKELVKEYLRVENTSLQDMKSCLAGGFPFVLGFSVYSGFESAQVAQDGQVSLPDADEQFLGGHATLAVGYDDSVQKFIIRNSWGKGWGDAGHFYMPYAYLTNPNLANDFWSIRLL